jgi:hypothetical protein
LGERIDRAGRTCSCLRRLLNVGVFESSPLLLNLRIQLVFFRVFQLVLSLRIWWCNVENFRLVLHQVLNILERLVLGHLALLLRTLVSLDLELIESLLAPELGLDLLVVHAVQSQGRSSVNH